MNVITKLKTEEHETHPVYPDGVIMIKENTSIEHPVAIVPFPMGRHKRGTEKQREYAKLLASAPELLEKLNALVETVGCLDACVLKDFYQESVITYASAKKLVEILNIGLKHERHAK